MEETPYADRLALSVDSPTRVRLPYAACLANTGGALHGGAILSLCLGAAAAGGGAVAGFAASFLSPAREELTTATATVAAAGRRTRQLDVLAVGADERPVARVLATVVPDGDVRSTPSYAAPASIAVPGEGARDDHDVARRSPYTRFLGATGLCSAAGVGAMTIPVSGNRNGGGAIDAGAVAGALDTCAALASRSLEPAREPRSAATVTMALAFEPLPAADLSLRARVVVRHGSSFLSHVEATAAGDDAVVASGTVCYRFRYED